MTTRLLLASSLSILAGLMLAWGTWLSAGAVVLALVAYSEMLWTWYFDTENLMRANRTLRGQLIRLQRDHEKEQQEAWGQAAHYERIARNQRVALVERETP